MTTVPGAVLSGSTSVALVRIWRAMAVSRRTLRVGSVQDTLQREDPPAGEIGYALHHRDHDDDEDQAGEHVPVAQDAARDIQLETDAAAAEDTERHGGAEVDVEGVKDVGDDGGGHLRQHAVADDLQAATAGRGDRLERSRIDL